MSAVAQSTAPQRFHTQDGIYFARSFGGWVELYEGNEYRFSFDPATWASVVAYHAYEINLAAALETAAARFRFLAEMQRQIGRPESKGNASILERHADDCLAAIEKARAASRIEAQRGEIGTGSISEADESLTPKGDAQTPKSVTKGA